MTVDTAQFSMLYALNEKQALHDAAKIFRRKYEWMTGTEAGEDPLKRVLRVAAHNAGYTFHVYKSNWVAIRKDLILPGSWQKGAITVLDNDKVIGPGHDLNIVWDSFRHDGLGDVTVMSSHYATKGRPSGKGIFLRNLGANRTLAHEIGDLADEKGAGNKLFFGGVDSNIIDKADDIFFGEKLTTTWDELGKYEGTGHDNIDAVFSYNPDGRVKAKYVRALDDREQFMFSDHFPVESGFEVKLLEPKHKA